jgi:diacylglycerol kinase (ATP)
MNSELRDKQKKRCLKRFFSSFKYSFEGLIYAYKFEQSMFIHLSVLCFVVIAGIILQISLFEWLICVILFGLVIAAELFNTAIEATIDLISPLRHPLAKIAKDTAAAAVFVLAIVSAISGLIIFLPKVLAII